jgi:lipid-binding SYLF domain-containing protein
MAYATTNPPKVVSSGIGGPSQWIYTSEDVHTTVAGADYFSNGDDLGMEVDDLVTVIKTTATIGATLHVVTAVTSGGAATVSAAILA